MIRISAIAAAGALALATASAACNDDHSTASSASTGPEASQDLLPESLAADAFGDGSSDATAAPDEEQVAARIDTEEAYPDTDPMDP